VHDCMSVSAFDFSTLSRSLSSVSAVHMCAICQGKRFHISSTLTARYMALLLIAQMVMYLTADP